VGGQVGEIGGFGGGVLAILGVFLGELGLDREICGAGGLGAQKRFLFGCCRWPGCGDMGG
jgi:hypothetical protein